MYDSLRLFYANGGGDCYIVSVGTYDAAGKTADDFTGTNRGIKTLEKVDEPTILVFPDNSLLTTGNDFYSVYEAALEQCNNLMDRVGLFHVQELDQHGKTFRSKIGVKDLKYGMIYSPWLKVNFPKAIKYRDFKDVISNGATSYKLSDLTADNKTKALVLSYEQSIEDVDTVNKATETMAVAPNKTLRERFTQLEASYQSDKTAANFMTLVNHLFEVARQVDVLVGSSQSTAVGNTDLKNSFENLIGSTLQEVYKTLISHDKELANPEVTGYNTRFDEGTRPSAEQWKENDKNIFADDGSPAVSSVLPSGTDIEKMDAMLSLLRPLFDQINNAWLDGVVNTARETETTKHKALLESFPLYKTIITGIQNASATVPPCGAVAGIYAYVDRTRGVWKAPANVSISGIIGPKDTFTASELNALNMDPDSGKSINAIRSFTGKGTLVYGARTLAGNDNEWRYVSVRRFFNFVEESVKKATEQFVFEPNDANTWVRVQAMIENFLTVLWRQGALQGVKPEHAFYVAVGLGKTMTPLDILEGRMIIEIGMAVVRPAEFIILKFSHKMAES
jgi:hypothetical protein